ncbi:MAG: methanogenesis marker 3 protein, partial [Methanoregula sp.]
MVSIHLDGERRDVPEGASLSSLLPEHPVGCAVGIIRPAMKEQAATGSLALATTAGEIIVEKTGDGTTFLTGDITQKLALHWSDRYAAAFGPFAASFVPERKPHLYERGDGILGCGGYDPARSYLIFAKSRHSADHGAAAGGGVVGRVVSGRAVLERWTTGDAVTKVEPVISWADTSRSFTTTDTGLLPEEGMQVVTYIGIVAQGYTPDRIDPESAGSVEHLLVALQRGRFVVGRATGTHILDPRLAGTAGVPKEHRGPRREGTVTVRTEGKSAGSVYIYRSDVPSS